jgi:hypothetical protein
MRGRRNEDGLLRCRIDIKKRFFEAYAKALEKVILLGAEVQLLPNRNFCEWHSGWFGSFF